jgi:hypothetical protein
VSHSSRSHSKSERFDGLPKEIHSLLCKEIRKILKRPGDHDQTAAVASPGGSPQKKAVPTCASCGKRGHRTDDCWKDVTCPICQKKGHIAKFCSEVTGKQFGNSSDKVSLVNLLKKL